MLMGTWPDIFFSGYAFFRNTRRKHVFFTCPAYAKAWDVPIILFKLLHTLMVATFYRNIRQRPQVCEHRTVRNHCTGLINYQPFYYM